MKLFILLLFLGPTTILNQPNFNAVITALKQSNTTLLAQHLDASVELVINDSDGNYTKVQAISIISEFLITNKPNNCIIAHSGSARDQGSYYCISKLSTGSMNYRVNIFFKEKSGKFLIQEIRIEED